MAQQLKSETLQNIELYSRYCFEDNIRFTLVSQT